MRLSKSLVLRELKWCERLSGMKGNFHVLFLEEGKFLQSLWLKVTKIRSFQALPNCTMLLKIQSMMWHIIWQLWFALPYNPMAAFVRTDTFNVIRFPQFPKGALDGAGGFSDLFCQFCD